MLDSLNADGQMIGLLALFSVITFFGTLFLTPFLVARIPADYFASEQPKTLRRDGHPLLRGLSFIARNALGLLLLFTGVILIFTPGQGVITILVGLMLMDFPGKYRLVRTVVTQPAVLRSINWLRAKADEPPLSLDEE